MKIKKSALLIFAGISIFLKSEEFIDSSKELNVFSSQYDFGTPIKKKMATDERKDDKKKESVKESNISAPVTEKTEESSGQKLKKELNLKCGGKCGIDFKGIPAK